MGLADRIENRGPITRKVVLALDSDAVDAANKAKRVFDRNEALGIKDDKAAAEWADARERLKDATVTIRVQAISPEDWDALQRQHPPTETQIEEARKQLGQMASVAWNVDTFVAAAWAECQVPDEGDERLSYERCQSLLKHFSQGEKIMLLQAIREVNESTISPDALGE